MKLCNEIFTEIFCSGTRPACCTKEINICCLYCDENKYCIDEYNKNDKKGIRPCSEKDFENIFTGCEFLN